MANRAEKEKKENADSFIARRGLVKGMAKAPEIAEEDVKIMFDTNVTGLINMTQAILPIFKQRPNGGSGDIINIGSIAGREPYPGGSIYCATKAAVRSFTDALRKELLATRIRIIGIDPGQVETVGLFGLGTGRMALSCVWLCPLANTNNRNFLSSASTATRRRQMLSTRKSLATPCQQPNKHTERLTYPDSGVDPLTPDDIAEVIVFSATRRENVVIADTLIFPSHQVRSFLHVRRAWTRGLTTRREELGPCTGSHKVKEQHICFCDRSEREVIGVELKSRASMRLVLQLDFIQPNMSMDLYHIPKR